MNYLNFIFRVPSVVLCSLGFCYIWLFWLELPSQQHIADYQFAVIIFGISCVLESFAEPVYLFSQAFLYVRWRVSYIVLQLEPYLPMIVYSLDLIYYFVSAAICGSSHDVHQSWNFGGHCSVLSSIHYSVNGLRTIGSFYNSSCTLLALLPHGISEKGRIFEK